MMISIIDFKCSYNQSMFFYIKKVGFLLIYLIISGFDALGYEEQSDYEIIQSTNEEFNEAIVRVNVFREFRQTIQVWFYQYCNYVGVLYSYVCIS